MWTAKTLFRLGRCPGQVFAGRTGHFLGFVMLRFIISFFLTFTEELLQCIMNQVGLRQVNLVLIAYVSSEGSGEPAHPHNLARTFAACSYKQ